MKVALITDTHFGIRNNSTQVLEYFEKFYNDVFFPLLNSRGINKIIHLGDVFDYRQTINVNTMYQASKMFLDKIAYGPYQMDVILGNHDVYYKNTNDINSSIIYKRPNIQIYSEPILKDGLLYLPWITKSNEDISLEYIENADVDYVFAHLQLVGFQQSFGSISTSGLSGSLFGRFTKVFTGHFHTKQIKDNIYYLGCPYEQHSDDRFSSKGFHIFDIDTGELEFIPNPYKLFLSIDYDDSNDQIVMLDPDLTYSGKYITVKVKSRSNFRQYDNFIEAIEKQQPIDIKIDDITTIIVEAELIENVTLTMDNIIDQSFEAVTSPYKLDAQRFLKTLYKEATDINYDG